MYMYVIIYFIVVVFVRKLSKDMMNVSFEAEVCTYVRALECCDVLNKLVLYGLYEHSQADKCQMTGCNSYPGPVLEISQITC